MGRDGDARPGAMPDERVVRARAGGRKVVALVGRLCDQKNPLLALGALARLPRDARPDLLLAGAETDPGLGALVDAEARRLGVAERVHRLGAVAPAEIPGLMRSVDALVVPSKHEAFGLVVLEGWARRQAKKEAKG